jgi:hypothetical protein
MSNDRLPKLPWQAKDKLVEIATEISSEIKTLRQNLGQSTQEVRSLEPMTEDELTKYIYNLREVRIELQEKDNRIKSQPVESITEYIDQLENIFKSENRALMLEYLSTMGLYAINDAIEIKPNYPVGDDNQPTTTAPGGMADIECYYKDFNMIGEVTMLNGRDQWFNEGQPVMRHLRDFENKNRNAYCLFIAPKIHTDSAETFWRANTSGYKGGRQRIAPITISQFVEVLKTLKRLRESNQIFTHDKLQDLVKSIADSANAINNSDDWIANTQGLLSAWSAALNS